MLDKPFKLFNHDCLLVLTALPDNSIDSIVTDPPYGLEFMSKEWDKAVPPVAIWQECLRVLKPGGYLLSFAGARTYHRMASNIEDAGFEIRDQLMWVYGSGFPKSVNLHLQIEKNAPYEAEKWKGWGSALKPAHEPIVMARKPFIGTLTNNVVMLGTGGLNIEACRVGNEKRTYQPKGTSANAAMIRVPEHRLGKAGDEVSVNGRWPANFIHDGSAEVIDLFPKKANDNANAARFFYCPKSSKADRDWGLQKNVVSAEEMVNRKAGSAGIKNPRAGAGRTSGAMNFHPTVKPIALMQWLVKLVTPADGLILDPFMGSGSTGIAAMREGFRFTGCELDKDYFEIAAARLKAAEKETGGE